MTGALCLESVSRNAWDLLHLMMGIFVYGGDIFGLDDEFQLKSCCEFSFLNGYDYGDTMLLMLLFDLGSNGDCLTRTTAKIMSQKKRPTEPKTINPGINNLLMQNRVDLPQSEHANFVTYPL